jgi:PAS domain S-box-containing protein
MAIQSIIVLPISIGLQFAAAFLAVRLTRKATGGIAWAFIAGALLLMAVRRSISFYNMPNYGTGQAASNAELVALLISILMVLGVAMIGPLFTATRRAEDELLFAHSELEKKVDERTRELNFQKLALDEHAIVSITDAKGNITYANDAFCKISGYSHDELINQNHRILKSDEHSPEFFADLWKMIANGKVWNDNIKNQNKNGSFYWVNATIVPFLNDQGKPFQYIAIRTDITERIEAERRAKEANNAKSEFLSSMSHELRTPMNAILGFAQMLEFNPKEPLTETQKESVNHIMKGGQHLLELINEVLDLAKIEAGKMEMSIEDISVKSVLDECLSLIHSMAEDRGIEITVGNSFDETIEIRTDHTRFRQSLLNLITNAIKYNRPNGTVTLDCHETPGAMLHINVADTGNGISENMLDDLFQPFNRLGAENTEIEGTGIGLTITKQIIEAMDGHIGVDTKIGEGSTFWIELPLSERKLIDEGAAGTQETGYDTKPLPDIEGTVLYVEDNPANLQLMEMIIERVEGLSMISAHNAELGIELAKSRYPNLIILDINLPGMDGYDALKKLKNIEKTKDIPIIALSANAMVRDIERGINAGFKQYLTKPIKVEEVVSAIKNVIQG